MMQVRKRKRRPKRERHPFPYYEEILSVTFEPNKIFKLLEDAAAQPEDFISAKDFELLYWLAQDNLRSVYDD